jgi:hypothetical protein
LLAHRLVSPASKDSLAALLVEPQVRILEWKIMSSDIHDAKHWLARADEARLKAKQIVNPDAQREILQIATGCQRLAQYAEERMPGKKCVPKVTIVRS